jgi:hypothetical protein
VSRESLEGPPPGVAMKFTSYVVRDGALWSRVVDGVRSYPEQLVRVIDRQEYEQARIDAGQARKVAS